MNLEERYAVTTVEDLAVSSTGTRLACVTASASADDDLRYSVRIGDAATGVETIVRDRWISSLEWAPDGDSLAFLGVTPELDSHSLSANDRETDGTPQVWVVTPDRTLSKLTEIPHGVYDYDWGPEGERIVVEAATKTQSYATTRHDAPIAIERFQHKYDGIGWVEDTGRGLFVVSTESDTITPVDGTAMEGAMTPVSGLHPRWGDEYLAFLSNRRDDAHRSQCIDLWIVRPDGTDLSRVTNSDVAAAVPCWGPAGKKLAFVTSYPKTPSVPNDIRLLDTTGDGDVITLSQELDRRILKRSLDWIGIDRLLGLVADHSRTRPAVFEPDEPVQFLDDRETLETVRVAAGGGQRIVLCRSSLRNGGVVQTMRVDRSMNKTTVTRPMAEFVSDHRHHLPDRERISWKSSDNTEVEGLLFQPNSDPPYPLLVSVHGGPFDFANPGFRFPIAYWTARGYAVFEPNYRGSISYGEAYTRALAGRWNDREVEDIMAGVDAVIDRGIADSSRVFVTGRSHGGTIVGYLLARSNRFVAGVAEHAVFDFRAAYGSSDSQLRWEQELGLPWENPDVYDRVSPITMVDSIETPLLLLAGGRDWHSPCSQAEQMYVSLKRRMVPTRLVIYPDESHEISTADRSIHRLREMTKWFERFKE